MDIVSAIASINALFIAFLISLKKQKSTSDFILIVWIINFAFHFFIPFGIERQIIFHESIWGFLMGTFVVAHAPFIFVYTNSIINPEFKVDFKNFYHFGFILIFIISFIPYLSLLPEERMEQVHRKDDLSYYLLLPMLTLLFIRLYFLVRTLIVLIKHQQKIKQSFSYKAKISLTWLKLIVVGFLGAIVLSFVLYGLASAKIISVFWMDYILIIINIVLFFYIAYSGYRQSAIHKENLAIIPGSIKVKVDNKKKSESKSIQSVTGENYNPAISDLLQLMEKEKLYLEPELNIGIVAIQLKIHAHQLSKLINNQLEKNFFEFVNDYRVEEFKKLAANPKHKHISILGLAMDAGFNSKASFNRIFKNSTGLTPSEFRESYKF